VEAKSQHSSLFMLKNIKRFKVQRRISIPDAAVTGESRNCVEN
jgi:hypothetical protein